MRRATCYCSRRTASRWHFYPRSPCGERHRYGRVIDVQFVISIHALLAESDAPSPPRREFYNNFYPRSPCGERPASSTGATKNAQISIHALLAESDDKSKKSKMEKRISIHALLAESDVEARNNSWDDLPFLSTLSLRRATAQVCQVVSAELHLNEVLCLFAFSPKRIA